MRLRTPGRCLLAFAMGAAALSCGGGSARIKATTAAASGSAPTVWNFDDPANRLAASSGPAQLAYHDPARTGWGPKQTRFAKASSLGLPPIHGADTEVMAYPATTPAQGYALTHHSAPNGASAGRVSNYTLVMDLYLPPGGGTYRALLQADGNNSGDAEMFVRDVAGGRRGVGVNSYYNAYGSMAPGSWHRVAIVVQCALGSGGTGQIYKYIDGLFVGGQYPDAEKPGDTRCRWALDPTFLLLTDNDNETAAGYVSSILYLDRLMMPDEIRALGGPHAAGANVPGAAATPPQQRAKRRVMIFGHRANSGRAPENTLAGLVSAFDDGADHVEVDVRKTADGKLVLMHDDTVDRTTDGSGAVDSLGLAAIKALEAGSWFDASFAGEKVPTLVEALTAAAGRGRLLLDIKLPGIGAEVRQALREAGVGDAAVWPSQQNNIDEVAADFKTHLPGAGMLWGTVPAKLDTATFRDLRRKGAVGFDVHYTDVTRAFIDAAHGNGMFVVVWTVLDPDTMLAMIALGVDGMETDYPAVLDSLMPPRRAARPATSPR